MEKANRAIKVDTHSPDNELLNVAVGGMGYVTEICLGHYPITNGILLCRQDGEPVEVSDVVDNPSFRDLVFLRQTRKKPASYGIYRSDHYCLSKQGEWDYEPLPSSRDDEYYENHRWNSALDAAKFYSTLRNKILKGNEDVKSK